MPAYDSSFNPPAPIAELKLIHPVSGTESGSLRGKLDTGADVINLLLRERSIAIAAAGGDYQEEPSAV